MDAVWVVVVGAVAGAVFGALGAIATTGWITRKQLKAQARYRAESNLLSLFRGIKARLEIERRANYPTISSNSGPFDIDHREQYVIEAFRNLADLPKDAADAVLHGLNELLGEEAVLYGDARAAAPYDDVGLKSERAAKSIELIKKVHEGTYEMGLIPQIGQRWGDDRGPVFDQAIAAVDKIMKLLR